MKPNNKKTKYPEIENSKEFIESLSTSESIDDSYPNDLIYKINLLRRFSFIICLLLGLLYSFIKYDQLGSLSIVYLLSFLFFSYIIKVFSLSFLEILSFKNTYDNHNEKKS